MSRTEIETAIQKNLPFSLRMADGHEYPVPHRDYIFLPPRGHFVIVADDEGRAHYLPLLTMTGLIYPQAPAA
jgi:hypothetical protein